jgi:hypothetical protein
LTALILTTTAKLTATVFNIAVDDTTDPSGNGTTGNENVGNTLIDTVMSILLKRCSFTY